MSQLRFTLLDALPDLIIGLVGIPVAVSAQSVAETAFTTDVESGLQKGIFYFVLILAIYGLASIGLLLVCEAEHYKAGENDELWQRALISRLLKAFVPMAGLIISLIALGVSYQIEMGPEGYQSVLLSSPSMPPILLFSSVIFNCLLSPGVWKYDTFVAKRFPIVTPYYLCVQVATLVIAIGWLATFLVPLIV